MLIENVDTENPRRSEYILLDQLSILKNRGYIDVTANGNGRFGLTIEQFLGIVQNSDKQPDFFGIELKTKVSNTLQTLFSLAPTAYIGCQNKRDLVDKFGIHDEEKNRVSLFSTFGVKQNNRGFSLSIESDVIIVNNHGEAILEYEISKIKDSLLKKHKKTAYINLSKSVNDGVEQCKIDDVYLCEEPSIEKFIKLVELGKVRFELSMYVKGGKLKDYGPFWRVQSQNISELYEFNKKVIW